MRVISVTVGNHDICDAVTIIAERIKHKIMARNGKVVFRIDRGDPNLVVNGDRNADSISASDGVLRCLADVFGTTVNNKGYQVLNDKVGIIYGGGINHEQYMEILTAMQANHFASSNLVVGVGGDVLQQQIRDDIGFSFKATNAVVNGKPRILEKCATAQTTSGCYSGKVMLVKGDNGYSTLEREEYDGYMQNELKLSYMDCKILIEQTVDKIRSRVL